MGWNRTDRCSLIGPAVVEATSCRRHPREPLRGNSGSAWWGFRVKGIGLQIVPANGPVCFSGNLRMRERAFSTLLQGYSSFWGTLFAERYVFAAALTTAAR